MSAPKLDRTPSIRDRVEDTLHAHRNELVALLSKYVNKGKCILQPHHILDALDEVQGSGGGALAEGPFLDVLRSAQEAIVVPPFVAIAVRPRPGVWEFVRVNVHELSVEQLTVPEYLCFKEALVDGQHNDPYILELDFEPFNASVPRPNRSSSIGNGVQFLNRHLSSIMFRNRDCLEPLLDFLRAHRHKGHVMMLNDRIQSLGRLQSVLTKAEEFQEWGLEKGWGDTAEHVLEMIHLLSDIIQAPDPSTLETFLGRIPMIFNVVVVSPHGYFGQANVLGLPDTGGQIVYILDQVRALENEMVLRLKKQGLDVTPKILIDAAGEIAAELQGTPDFIIGNYSDGNLVASLLSYKMGITQCNIAHALEKTKYPDSDIYWKKFDEKYHFSCQFTADIIAMNNADFIITSTYQEIAGSGHLDDRSKPILFSMARLDRVKNITGLVEAFAKCSKLRELVNLVVVAGYNDVKKSKDREEIAEIEKMHELIKTYNLFGQFRWISAQTNRARNGELYRYIADTHGAFVQPAFYEAFGLTVVEAMTCGLPTFATLHGGPAEIIEHGISGFHIDPYHPDQAANLMADFFERSKQDPNHWVKISDAGLQRIYEKYTWKIYSERLMTLAGVYGFWKYVSKLERRETRRYLEMFYILKFRELVKTVPLAVDQPQ
nr:unnamed protein product [Digitaria exilis]CAB3500876.1 unnamed protein product [Digitaria exilis]